MCNSYTINQRNSTKIFSIATFLIFAITVASGFAQSRGAPQVENESPSDGAVGVALDAEIVAEFDRDVNARDLEQVVIHDADSNEIGGISADLDNNVLTIDHDDFDYLTEYTVVLPSGTVENDQGVGNGTFRWSFTTFRGAPEVISETPSDGSGDVALDATVSVEFDQDVVEEDLDDVEIRDAEDDELDGLTANLDGNVLSITHPGFNPATEYTVIIPEGTVENDIDVGNEEFVWSFTTILSAPLAVNETPVDGTDGVPLDADVSVEFDQNVTEDNLSGVEIRDHDNNPVEEVSAELDNDELIISHAGFANFTEYTVIIPEGTVFNEDNAGNEEFTWSFTTVSSAPVAVNISPPDGSVRVALDVEVSVEFDQDVNEGDLELVEIRDADQNEITETFPVLDGNVLTITHPGFDQGTEYTVIIPEGTVDNNNEIGNEQFSWGFSTIQDVPVVINEQPEDGSERVVLDADVRAGFNQSVSEGALDNVEIRDSGNNLVEEVSAELVNNELIISHADFAHFTEYMVIIPEGTVESADGEGNEEFTWRFTTIRSTPLAVNEFPADGTEGVSLDANVSVEFDQDVSANDLDIIEIRDIDDNQVEVISVGIVGNELIIAHADFEYLTEYRVIIPEGAVVNDHGFENEEYIWSFITLRFLSPPFTENETPMDNTTGNALDAEVSVGFNQDVVEINLDQVAILDAEDNELGEVSAELEDNVLLFTHPGFAHFTEYTVIIPEGTVENSDELVNEEFIWSFLTIRGAPVAENESPPDGSERVALEEDVSIGFDQEVSVRDAGQVEISDANNNEVVGLSAELQDNLLTISHSGFNFFTAYTVTIPAGTVENTDEVGNEEYSWSFTTMRDAPVVGDEFPASGSAGVSLDPDISATFDQPVTMRESAGVEIRDADNNEVENISLELEGDILRIEQEELDYFTEYTVTIPAGIVENEGGIANEAYSWSFTTLQRLSAPLVEITSPPDGAEGVALDNVVSSGFNQEVSETDLAGVQIRDGQGHALGNISASLENNELTVTQPGFSHFTEYTVNIPEGTVENADEVGNEAFTWSFTTIRQAPVAITISPADGIEGVALDASVSIEFDQQIIAADPELIEIRNPRDDEFEEVSADIDDTILNIRHAGFDYETEYVVTIPAGTIENADGVENEEITWSFTTLISAPLTVRLSAPEDGSAHVELQPELVWEQSGVAETYHLQLTSGTGFDTGLEIEESGLEVTVFAVEEDLDEDQTYSWRVRAESAGAVGNWSQTWTFSTRPPPLVERVVLSEPVDFAGSIALEPELIWEPVDRATHYNVEVATDPGFNELVETANEVEATSLTSSGHQHYTIYHWRVQGENEVGTGEWSEPGVFITIAEPPELQFPADDARQISIAPRLNWNSNYESTRFEIRLGADESFSQVHQSFNTIARTLSINGLAAGTEYHWQVRLSDDLTTSEWSVPRAFTTRDDPVEETVQVSINFQTENKTSIASQDFRLIGLPGTESIALDEIFAGEYEKDWRAFTDTGGEEYYLEEYNPKGGSFSFGRGRGYWVFNREPVSAEKNVTPVELDEGDSYTISLNRGWNIIANPFNTQIQWEHITDLNEIEAPLYGYNRFFETVEWLVPLEGYYLYNDPAWEMSTLQIPYGDLEKRRSKEQDGESGNQQSKVATHPDAKQSAIRLHAEFYDSNNSEDRIRTGVELVYSQDIAKVPYPSLKMAHYGVVLENPEDSSRIHQRMNAGYETNGTEHGLRVKAPVGRKIKWQADFREMHESSRILLVNPVTREAHLLADGQKVELSVTEPEVRYQLFTGDEAYLQGIRDDQLPEEFTLKPNYPNPFNPITTIRYSLVEDSQVNLEVYNVLGQRVATLVNENQDAGWHSVQFDGSRLATGTYMYRLVTGGQVKTGKMMLVK